MSSFPHLSEVNAIWLPSGAHFGEWSYAGCIVNLLASPPSDGTVHMSPCQLNAIWLPSGDGEGCLGRIAS